MSDTRTDAHQKAFNDNGPRFGLDDILNAYARQLLRESEASAAAVREALKAITTALAAWEEAEANK